MNPFRAIAWLAILFEEAWLFTSFAVSRANFGVAGDENGERFRIVFRLGNQVGGNPLRISIFTGDNNFSWAGQHVDAAFKRDQLLGCRDIEIAGSDNFIDTRHAGGPVGERSNRLRTADTIQLLDPGQVGGRQSFSCRTR